MEKHTSTSISPPNTAADFEVRSRGLGRRQLRAVLRKNCSLKLRAPGQLLCEVLSPLLMLLMLVIGWVFSLRHLAYHPPARFAEEQSQAAQDLFTWAKNHIVDIPTTPLMIAYPRTWMEGEASDEWNTDASQLTGAIGAYPPTDGFPSNDASDELDTVVRSDSPELEEYDADDGWGSFSLLHPENKPFAFRKPRSSFSPLSFSQTSPTLSPSSPSLCHTPSINDTCVALEAMPGKQFCYNGSDIEEVVSRLLSYNGPMAVPSFDTFVSAHYALKMILNATIESHLAGDDGHDLQEMIEKFDKYTDGQLANIIYLGRLIFTPDTHAVRELVNLLNQTHPLFHRVFSGIAKDENEALQHIPTHPSSDEDRTWALMVFDEVDIDGGRLEYTIRMNASTLASTKSTIDSFAIGINEAYKRYFWSGFLTLQRMIEDVALNISANDIPTQQTLNANYHLHSSHVDTPIPSNTFIPRSQELTGIPFPVPSYSGNRFYNSIGPLIGLVFCLSILYPTSRLIKGIVEEKETKTKETMKMMGLKDWVWSLSWFITSFIQFVVTAVFVVLLLHFTFLHQVDPTLLLVLFICFTLSQISFAFLISVFFSKAKLAGIIGPIVLFAATMPRYAFYSYDATGGSDSTDDATVLRKTFCAILSPTAFTFGADLLVKYESAQRPLGWGNIDDDPFSMSRVLAFLLADFILYAILAWWLDQVVPNDYGQRKNVCFCLEGIVNRCRGVQHQQRQWARRNNQEHEDDDEDGDVAVTPIQSHHHPHPHPPLSNGSRSSISSQLQTSSSPLLEPVPCSLHHLARVVIKGLRRQFNEGWCLRGKSNRVTTAVHGLDLTLYEGHITALLGSNGAGKSTTISMLTGLISPSSGDCLIDGHSILTSMPIIRQSLGICPQANVLFSRLSVKAHLELYGTLKGVAGDRLEEEVQSLLEELELTDKANVDAGALSGGMQRKLQCAMALIGGSKVVFLDEPTSGMDPAARRSTWEVLRKAKKDRVIVLTTHFMDEADLLGDRIAIMADGQLRCCGSSLFLKSKYGAGYTLTLVKASKACRTEEVSKMVMFFVPDAKIMSTAGGEMSYRLPLTSVAQFPGLLQQLEERRHAMGIGGYGISQTTLEEVFVRCVTMASTNSSANGDGCQLKLPTSHDSLAETDSEQPGGKHSLTMWLSRALSCRKKRNPMSVSDGGVSAVGSINSSVTTHDRYTMLQDDASASVSVRNIAIPSSPQFDEFVSPDPSVLSPRSVSSFNKKKKKGKFFPVVRPIARFWTQYRTSFQKRYICALRDVSGRFFEMSAPILVVMLVLFILRSNNKMTNQPQINMAGEIYIDTKHSISTPLWYSQVAGQTMEAATLYSLAHIPLRRTDTDTRLLADSTQPSSPPSPADPSSWNLFTLEGYNLSSSVSMEDALAATHNSHWGRRYGALIFNDTIPTQLNNGSVIYVDHPELTIMHNSSYYHAFPVLMAEIAQARWNANRWAANPTMEANKMSRVVYRLRNHPLPATSGQSLRTRTYLMLFAALFMLIPFCWVPASFVLFVVKERSVKSKHQQLVSGLNPYSYWLATWTWDVLNYLAIALAVLAVVLAFGTAQFVGSSASFAATCSLLLLYGAASIPLCYCYSFCFNNYTSAQVGIAGLNLLTGFILVIGSFMLDQLASTKHANQHLKSVYRLFPPFTLGEGLINLSTSGFMAQMLGRSEPNPFEWHVAGRNVVYLAVEAVVYLAITFVIESNWLQRLMRWIVQANGDGEMRAPRSAGCKIEDEDEDVAAERRRLAKMRIKVHQPKKDGTLGLHVLASPVTPGLFTPGQMGPPSTLNASLIQNEHSPWSFSLNPIPNHAQPTIRSMAAPAITNTDIEEGKNTSLDQPQQTNLEPLPQGSQPPATYETAQLNPTPSPMAWASPAHFNRNVDDKDTPLKTLAVTLPPLQGKSSWDGVFPSSQSPMSTTATAPSPTHGMIAPFSPTSSSSSDEQDILVLQNLRKVYPARGGGAAIVAVDSLSLGIPRGQVFGFLGLNGAGKTTTMKMLTGDESISHGRAYINGWSVLKQLPAVRKEIGYCPQFDPLIDAMTPREQLTMYARIHGMDETDIPRSVNDMIHMVGLAKFADKVCGPFSGGNKRKLSLAIALIGNPSVVFLDEPSTGMDPVSRRFMWAVISAASVGRSLLLTTHSMEECEALCDRIGIMRAGRLQCLGSIQHLKSRFGSGYLMELSTDENMTDRAIQFIQHTYPHATMEEMHAGRMKFRLPQAGTTLSHVFATFEANKKSLHIHDYAISQCSLEQIFISQVKKKTQEDSSEPGRVNDSDTGMEAC